MSTRRLTDERLVRGLAQVGTGDVDQVGAKAASLASLIHAGFNVPEAVVVTTEAHTRFAGGPGKGSLPATLRASPPSSIGIGSPDGPDHSDWD